MKINLTKFIGIFLLIACFSCLLSNYVHAESINVSISGPKEGLVNEELSYSVDVKQEWAIEKATWDFGDGSSGEGISVSHTYSNAGANTVRVTVEASKEITKEDGSIDHEHETQSDTKKVTVTGRLSISADPKELPADGKSTSAISVSTLGIDDNPFTYKRKIELSISRSGGSGDNELPELPNLPFLRLDEGEPETGNNESSESLLTLGSLEMNEDGSRTATATAGTKAGTAKIKAKGRYLSSASCTIKVKEAKNLKLSISASPDILPADGKSQTVLSIKVLNEDGKLDTTYNGSVSLKSSNASALKVPNSVNIKEGRGSTKAKAGSSAAEVTVTVSGDGLASTSCKVTVFKVTLSVDDAYIAAESDWTGIDNSFQEALITVNIQPKSAEDKIADKITLKILKVTGGRGYNPGKGKLKQSTKNSNLWKYIPFEESRNEDKPQEKNVNIAALYSNVICSNFITIRIGSIWTYLNNYGNCRKSIDYAIWKYNINTSNLTSISYDSSILEGGQTTYGGKCRIGQYAITHTENICASVLGHENVHGGQPLKYFLIWMEAEAEVPAYGWEINNSNITKINNKFKYNPTHLREVIRKYTEFKKQL
jgi:hypothetical protein